MLVPRQLKINRRPLLSATSSPSSYGRISTMTGNIGVFIAGDLVSFYLVCALVIIPAHGLFAF
jgi:hypothetical protein